MTNLASIARALGGTVSSGQVLAPGPGHGKHDRSLAVFIDPNAPDLFRVHSHAGDDWRSCRDYVKQRLGIADDPRREFSAKSPAGTIVPPAIDNDRSAGALAIWAEARSIDGTVGLTYLAKRGVDLGNLPPYLHRTLRWHPSCPWEGGRHPCMVALFTDTISGEPKAIHRTAINPAGAKVGRKVLGPMAGCVIRLWPDEMVTEGLVLGEGIETTLTAATRIEHCGTYLRPAWAAGSAGAMAKFLVLAGIEALTLLVDNDASGAGQKAAHECSARWTAANREVFRLVPKTVGIDLNDIVVEVRA